MRTWSFLCVRIHTGVGHTDSESAQHFWLGKTDNFFLCSWRDSNLRSLDLESNTLPTEPPRHIPFHVVITTTNVSLLQESRCAYVVLVMAVYWVTEAVPIAATAFMPVILFPLLGVMTAGDVTRAYISVSAALYCWLGVKQQSSIYLLYCIIF